MKKIELKEIKIKDKVYPILINRKKIKHTYIRVNEKSQIVVNTNRLTTIFETKTLIEKHQDKILEMIEKIKPNHIGNQVSFLGKNYKVCINEAKSFHYVIRDEEIIFYTKLDIQELIDSFYKKEAHKIFPKRLKYCYDHFIKYHQISFPELSIRKMKRRLGTCYYGKNKIYLNSHNMKYDIETIDYVIYHELCHFIHPNHSKNFYQLLDSLHVSHKQIRKNLKKY